jgi:hypothetical protein
MAISAHELAAPVVDFRRTLVRALAAPETSVPRIRPHFDSLPGNAHAPQDRVEDILLPENAAIREEPEFGGLEVVSDASTGVLSVVTFRRSSGPDELLPEEDVIAFMDSEIAETNSASEWRCVDEQVLGDQIHDADLGRGRSLCAQLLSSPAIPSIFVQARSSVSANSVNT